MLSPVLLVLSLGAAAQDPVEVGATLRSMRVHVGESTVLQISVETRGSNPADIRMPELPAALEVGSTQDFSQLKISYPGGRSRLLRRDVVLVPRAAGEYHIGPVAVQVAGRTYRTEPVTLLVLPARTGDARAGGSTEVRLRAWLAPDTAYIGQQVLLHAEALFPEDLRLRQTRPASYDAPTPPNFWNQDLPESVSLGLRLINGEVFESQTFRRAYFPMAAGSYTLAPARLIYEVRRGFLYAPENRELASDSLRLTVLPLPADGRPDSFTGAVGRFTVRAELQPSQLAVGDAATLTVEVRGKGNVKALPPPRLPELRAIEVYPPSEDARSETADGVIRGLKRFSWVLIPAHAGSIRLPPIEYAFFDAEAGAYETATTDALSLVVLPAGTSRDGGGESELRGITKEPWGDALGWVRTRWFAAAQLIPLLALLLVIAIRRASRPRQPSRRKLRNERVARFDALRAAAPVEADRSFFGTLASYVRESTAECLDRTDLRTLPGPAFHRALRDSGVGPATCADLSELLARVEHARFAPEPPSSAERTALLEEAERIVERLERDARPARPRGSSAAVGALFIALAAAAPLGAAQGDFATGVTAYQDARYEDARRTFARYVQDAPRDASGWYNLGNAHFAAGDRGHAVWAWLRALRLRPRYYAARQNLAAAGAQDAVRWLPPPFVPTTNEAILALALTWWIAAAIMCLAVLGRRKKWFIAAAAVLLVGLVAVAAALPASVHRATAVTIDAATPLLAGPAYQSDRIGTLEQGAPLGVLETLGPWLRVRTSDQTQGWVEADRVGRI